jgi:hypothetical protein
MVSAYLRAAQFVETSIEEAAEISAKYIGLSPEIIRKALKVNRPNVNAIRNQAAMDQVIQLMIKRGYIERPPTRYKDLSFMDKCCGRFDIGAQKPEFRTHA